MGVVEQEAIPVRMQSRDNAARIVDFGESLVIGKW